MPSRIPSLWLLLGGILLLRLVTMGIVPFAETTEPRYAEMARLMAVSGDWITPWFSQTQPFWGKPPLAFWAEAISIHLLGNSEFAIRLPSWLATLATLYLVFRLAQQLYDTATARRAALIYATCALVYVIAGAVLTDPFLALGTTWMMAGFVLNRAGAGTRWGYGFFLGMSIGLLAKGPLVLVLAGGATAPALLYPALRQQLRQLPWAGGLLLTSVLVLPWYVLAEQKTPGFLQYFLVGEHILRFIDPGWSGDLYGSAHQRAHGTIWLYALAATFPWSLLVLPHLLWRAGAGKLPPLLQTLRSDPRLGYLLGWALFTPVFFTLAGNILWTYVLPAIPAFSILAARSLSLRLPRLQGWSLPVPAAVLIGGIMVSLNPLLLNTEKPLVDYAEAVMPGTALAYLDSLPFSARYYSEDRVQQVESEQLTEWLATRTEPALLAVRLRDRNRQQALAAAGYAPNAQSSRFMLYRIQPQPVALGAWQPASPDG